jgi:hypothetical protein
LVPSFSNSRRFSSTAQGVWRIGCSANWRRRP